MISLRSRYSYNAFNRRWRLRSSTRRLGRMILVLLIGISEAIMGSPSLCKVLTRLVTEYAGLYAFSITLSSDRRVSTPPKSLHECRERPRRWIAEAKDNHRRRSHW